MPQWSLISFSANQPKSTNPAFSPRFLQCFSPFWQVKRRLSALICHQEHQLCHFAMACFLRHIFVNTHTTTALSCLTSGLQRLKALNGAAAFLRFCVQLGSNYFNYTVAAFSADVWLLLTLLSVILYRLCPNQLIKSSQTRFVNLSYFQVGTFFRFFKQIIFRTQSVEAHLAQAKLLFFCHLRVHNKVENDDSTWHALVM